jgi:hypothetical protein
MNISQKLITLGLAFSLLGSTRAFARPMPHFENGCLSYEKKDGRDSCSDSKSIRRDRLCVSSVS